MAPFAAAALARAKGWERTAYYDTSKKLTNLYFAAPGVPPPERAPDGGSPLAAHAAAAPDVAGGSAASGAAASSSSCAGCGASASGAARWCVFCGAGEHLMAGCPQFQRQLASIFEAGIAAGRRLEREQAEVGTAAARPATAPAAAQSPLGNDWGSLTQRAFSSMQAAMNPALAAARGAMQAAVTVAAAQAELCALCGTGPPSCTAIPCGHCICQACAASLEEAVTCEASLPLCPLCGMQVGGISNKRHASPAAEACSVNWCPPALSTAARPGRAQHTPHDAQLPRAQPLQVECVL